jgi:hypothetical protein
MLWYQVAKVRVQQKQIETYKIMLQQYRWIHRPSQLFFRGTVNSKRNNHHHCRMHHNNNIDAQLNTRKRILSTIQLASWSRPTHRFMSMMLRQNVHSSDIMTTPTAISTTTKGLRRWSCLTQQRQQRRSIRYCDSTLLRRRDASGKVTRRHFRTTTTLWSTNNNRHDRPTTIPSPPLPSQHPMGIFRLLNDTQRTILAEQQQLTAQVVRANEIYQ